MSAVAVGASLALATPALAQDSDQLRFYLGVREGESNPITKANDVASVSLGASFNRYLGAEFSVDSYELYLDTPSQGRVAELGVLGLLPQVRLRYPLLGDRLVPYFLAGGGLAIAQINDASVPTEWANSGSLTSLRSMGAVGGGVEYFISHDIALGVEGKYLITGSNVYDAEGTKNGVDMNVGILTFGLRAFYPELHGDERSFAAARRARRFYLNVRFGGAVRRAGDVFPGIRTEPEQSMFGSNFDPLYAVSLGAQLGEIFDLELSGSNYELRFEIPSAGSVEYAVFPLLLQPKLHLPLSDLHVDPYVLAGVGAEVVEVNETGGSSVTIEGNGVDVIGALGAGVDYFLTSDIAFGLEAKYLFSRGHTLEVAGGPPLRGDLDAFFLSLGVRAFLFDF